MFSQGILLLWESSGLLKNPENHLHSFMLLEAFPFYNSVPVSIGL